eukprot:5261927-Amphidinium_carterae.1
MRPAGLTRLEPKWLRRVPIAKYLDWRAIAMGCLGPRGSGRPFFRGAKTWPRTWLSGPLGWTPQLGGWSCRKQYFTWYEAALGGVWHEARTHSVFAVGDLSLNMFCVRCREEVEDLSHI